mmetsp:Transcript_121630/g.190837  ORF Transcript_121630/g.190837 Transcript_121630/m.190837 type:complete len:196 (-) Transcript_121630:48-635(-)
MANPALPEWAALTKVCYRVAMSEKQDDWDNRQKVGLCIEYGRIIAAELKEIDGEEWLIDKSVPDQGNGNVFALPLRKEGTGEPVWSIMEGRNGQAPPIAKIPDGVIVSKQPPEGFVEAFPPNAKPGGSWVDLPYCGPVTIVCALFPCCWICLCALGKGKPVDFAQVYVDTDGKKWKESGQVYGKPEEQPEQQTMS